MKLGIKKFIYLINDITNLLLGKEKDDSQEKLKKFRTYLIVTLVLLAISVVLNVILFLK